MFQYNLIKKSIVKILVMWRWYFTIDYIRSPNKMPKNFYMGKHVRIFPRTNVIIDNNVWIGEGCRISTNKTGKSDIYIGPYTLFADNVHVIGGNHEFRRVDVPIMFQGEGKQGRIIFHGDSWICARSTILSNSEIPRGCIVGACSLVNKEFRNENSLIVGNPSKDKGKIR